MQSHRIVDIEQMSARADDVSRLYAQRFGIDRDASPDEQFTGELADVLCHVLLLARFHGVDLSSAVEAKWFRWLDREIT